MKKIDTLIIGAGLSGLSAAFKLQGKTDYLLIEKENKAGGLSGSLKKNGFIFDYSGHLLHLHNEKTKKLILKLLKENYTLIKRKSQIYSHKVFSPYPFQFNLFNLPAKAKKECISGFINAYKKRLTPSLKTKTLLNFKNWSLSLFGEGINKHFMLPYNNKLSDAFNGIFVHCCGNFKHNLDNLAKHKKLRGVDFKASEVSYPTIVERLSGKTLLVVRWGLNKDIHFESCLDFLKHVLDNKKEDTSLYIFIEKGIDNNTGRYIENSLEEVCDFMYKNKD